MLPVCTADEVRALDQATIASGVPGAVLMDHAARGLADAVRRRFDALARQGVTVVCGPGNNGGDGYAAARWLRAWGYPARTWSLAPSSSGDAAIFRAAAAAAGVPDGPGLGACGVIVDAVFGTGLTREVTGELAQVLVRMDAHPAPIVAADLPSGLHTDTGMALGESVVAACTVTFGRLKRGLYAGEGPARCGEVELVDLGFGDAGAGAALVEASDVAWPRRAATDHKTRSGHLLVIAGSTAMAGAAVLCCQGALAAGAGLVTLLTARHALPRLGALPPEVMVLTAGADHLDLVRVPDLGRFSAIAAGPGLGGGDPLPPSTEMALAGLWSSWDRPLVYDADALAAVVPAGGGGRVITPHPGEAARLLGRSVAAVEADRFAAVGALAGPGITALLKGHRTLVATGGQPVRVNPTGGPVLGTGGSGDVLTGVVGALLARGVPAADAAWMAAWVHGRAGDRLAARGGEGWRASDVAAAVAEVLREG